MKKSPVHKRSNKRVEKRSDSSSDSDSSVLSFSESESERLDESSSSKDKPLQLIELEQSDDDCFTFKLNNELLEDVLKTTRNRPLVIISIGGSIREGKSFLMNYLIRKLEGMETDVEFMSNKTKPLSGFRWKHGMNPETKGIWIWSRAFLVEGDEDEVAILLLDTQGVDEENMSREEISALLGLTMLTSSCFIFNVSGDLADDTLSNLSTYLKFGLHAIENDDSEDPPFQDFSVVVRDWNSPGSHPFGKKGGKQLLDDKVLRKSDVKGKAAKEQKKIREAIKKCFIRVDCWLMPNIGEMALRDLSNGTVADLSPDFAQYLEIYIDDLLSSVAIKKAMEAEVKNIEFRNFLRAYVSMFNGDTEITPEGIWEVTVHVAHENIIENAMQAYHEIFQKKRKPDSYLSDDIIGLTETQAKKKAMLVFKRAKKQDEYRMEFEKKLEKRLKDSFENIKKENGKNRSSFVAEKIRTASDMYRSILSEKLDLMDASAKRIVFHDEGFIFTTGASEQQTLTTDFRDSFPEEEEDKLNALVNSLEQVLSSVLDTFIQKNRDTQRDAESAMEKIVESLLEEYLSSMRVFLGKHRDTHKSILEHFHSINRDGAKEKFKKKDKVGSTKFHAEFEARLLDKIDEEYKIMENNLNSTIEENTKVGMAILKQQADGYLQVLTEKAKELESENELRLVHQQAVPNIIVKFNEKNPFPENSSQREELNTRLKEQLEHTFQMAVQQGIVAKKRTEELYKNAVESSHQIYQDEMSKARDVDGSFFEEKDLNENHKKICREALVYFDNMTNVGKKPDNAEEHKNLLKRRIGHTFEVFKKENELARTLAISEAKNLFSESVKLYMELMKDPSENCTGQNELKDAHLNFVEAVLLSFRDNCKVKNENFVEQNSENLVKEMDETFEEVQDIFLMKRREEEASTRQALEHARKYYHEEMQKHLKNDLFLKPAELQVIHNKVSQTAVERCSAQTALKETQKLELSEFLVESFQKYLKENDMKLGDDMNEEAAIGIDLGTTYCCVAVYHRRRVVIIPNSLGTNTTPSYVAFDEGGSKRIGQPAKDNAYRNPENTVFDAKRIIGRQMNDPELENDMKFWPFTVVQGETGPEIDIRGKTYPPEQIASILLMHLRDEAEKHLGIQITKAVITVPAYFTDSQRQATLDAGEISGLEVLHILNEPTAAAIAYKLQRFSEDARKVLIFDLGGGTFDVAVLETVGDTINVLGVDGDTHLGGEDFDKNMMKYCAAQFLLTQGTDLFKDKDSSIKLTRDTVRQRLRRLQTHCEKSKKELASALNSDVSVDALVDGKDLTVTFTRAKFEELNEPLFKKTINIVEKALKDTKVRKEEINDIVLVGGSTRIPKVQQMLKEFFNEKALNHSINPDEAVAYGAAVQAAILNGEEAKKAFNFTSIQDVCPMSIGVEAVVDGNPGQFSVIIPKNTKIPVKMKEWYGTYKDNQTNIRIKIYQGESQNVSENALLGEFILDGIPPGKAGRERIDIIMESNAMGILHVKAICLSTRGAQELTVTENKGRLTKARKQRLLQESTGTAAQP